MKRSDMLNKVAVRLSEMGIDCGACYPSDVAAWHILNIIEDGGMLPPAYIDDVGLETTIEKIRYKWEEES